jgi:hypothetical protein
MVRFSCDEGLQSLIDLRAKSLGMTRSAYIVEMLRKELYREDHELEQRGGARTVSRARSASLTASAVKRDAAKTETARKK